MKRTATAQWNGSGKEGQGHVTTKSKALNQAPYTYLSRFEEGEGTNPEELIAAAHAACFTMKLSFLISEAGYTPSIIETTCYIDFENGKLTNSHLETKATVPGMGKEAFEKATEIAKENCPVSQALKINITMKAKLEWLKTVSRK